MATITKHKQIKIFANAIDLFQFAADHFKQSAIRAVQKKGLFSVVLAGGNTPKLFFDILTSTADYQNNIPWQHIQFFFGDERYVAADNTKSNYHTAYQHLLSKVAINPNLVYPMSTQFSDPRDAAQDYEQTLRKAYHLQENTFPQFDLVYLGLGDDAHTASLMPQSELVKYYAQQPLPDNSNQLVASLFDTHSHMYRITLTPLAINHANNIVFMVSGANKASAVYNVLAGPSDALHYPAQLIYSLHGETIWYLDQAAAKQLNRTGI